MTSKECANCKTTAGPLSCCPCLLVYYCGKQCQVRHWDDHHVECNRTRADARPGCATPSESSRSSAGLTEDPRETPGGGRGEVWKTHAPTPTPTPTPAPTPPTASRVSSPWGAASSAAAATTAATAEAKPRPLTSLQVHAIADRVETLAKASPTNLTACLVELLQKDPLLQPVVAKHLGLCKDTLLVQTETPRTSHAAPAAAAARLPVSSYYPVSVPSAPAAPATAPAMALGVPLSCPARRFGGPGSAESTPETARDVFQPFVAERSGTQSYTRGLNLQHHSAPQVEPEADSLASLIASSVLD